MKIENATLRLAQNKMLEILKEVDRICDENNIEYFLADGTLLGAVRHGGFIPWDDDIDIGMFREDYKKFMSICNKELKSDYFMQTVESDENYDIYHIPLKIRDNNSLLIEENDKKYHQGIYIDIFPFDYIPKNKKKFKLQRYISTLLLSSNVKVKREKTNLTNDELKKYPIYCLINGIIKYPTTQKLLKKLNKWNDSDSEYISYGIETIWNTMFNKEWIFPLKKIEFEGEQFLAPNNPDAYLTKLYGDYMTLPSIEERKWHSKKIIINKKEEAIK